MEKRGAKHRLCTQKPQEYDIMQNEICKNKEI